LKKIWLKKNFKIIDKEKKTELEEKETERLNLISIINKNISKLCKEQDYSKNETAQRKVRTLFNIITDSSSAEEMYDKIELEGLQYFAEIEVERRVNKSNSRSPSINKTKTHNPDSIVSKILTEINTPKPIRKQEEMPLLQKSETVGEVVTKKEVTICTLTRNKASRRVKKFKTSRSSVSLDQLGKNSSDSNSRSSESDSMGSSAEHIKSLGKSQSPVPIEIEEDTPSVTAKSTTEVQKQDDDIGNAKEEQLDDKTDRCNEIQNDLIDKSANPMVLDSASSNTQIDLQEIESKHDLTAEMVERKQQSVIAQRNFSEALKESKDKMLKSKKRITIDENSIVSKILGESKTNSTPIEETIEDSSKSLDDTTSSNLSRREKTISICSDNIPDLCPIEDEEDINNPSLEDIEPEPLNDSYDDLEDTIGSYGHDLPCPLSNKHSGSIFFMTDFDDEEEEIQGKHSSNSDEESFVDANEHLSQEDHLNIKPLVQEVISNVLEDFKSNGKISEETPIINKVSSKLVSPLTNLVKTIIEDRLSCSSKGISPFPNTPDCSLRPSSINTVSIVEDLMDTDMKVDMDVEEVNECDNVFDISMKRLDFIESSFKTILSDEAHPVPAIEHKKETTEERMKRIKEAIKSSMDKEEKLRLIEEIMEEKNDNDNDH